MRPDANATYSVLRKTLSDVVPDSSCVSIGIVHLLVFDGYCKVGKDRIALARRHRQGASSCQTPRAVQSPGPTGEHEITWRSCLPVGGIRAHDHEPAPSRSEIGPPVQSTIRHKKREIRHLRLEPPHRVSGIRCYQGTRANKLGAHGSTTAAETAESEDAADQRRAKLKSLFVPSFSLENSEPAAMASAAC